MAARTPTCTTLRRPGAPRCLTPTGTSPGTSRPPRPPCASPRNAFATCTRSPWPGTTGCAPTAWRRPKPCAKPHRCSPSARGHARGHSRRSLCSTPVPALTPGQSADLSAAGSEPSDLADSEALDSRGRSIVTALQERAQAGGRDPLGQASCAPCWRLSPTSLRTSSTASSGRGPPKGAHSPNWTALAHPKALARPTSTRSPG